MTKELQQIEDELDAAESRLGSITEQLKTAEAQADESERFLCLLTVLRVITYSCISHSHKNRKSVIYQWLDVVLGI